MTNLSHSFSRLSHQHLERWQHRDGGVHEVVADENFLHDCLHGGRDRSLSVRVNRNPVYGYSWPERDCSWCPRHGTASGRSSSDASGFHPCLLGEVGVLVGLREGFEVPEFGFAVIRLVTL